MNVFPAGVVAFALFCVCSVLHCLILCYVMLLVPSTLIPLQMLSYNTMLLVSFLIFSYQFYINSVSHVGDMWPRMLGISSKI